MGQSMGWLMIYEHHCILSDGTDGTVLNHAQYAELMAKDILELEKEGVVRVFEAKSVLSQNDCVMVREKACE